MASISRGDLITLDIEKFADKGASLARIDGYVVFVEGAVPGDRVKAYVYQAKSNFAKAKLDTLVEPSPRRTQPKCRYADTCGGCAWQHVQYTAQLEAKQQSVEEAFTHHSDFTDIEVAPVVGMDEPFYYRNKMDFDFSADRWLTRDEIDSGEDFDTDFALGMHAPGHYDKVIDLHECHLQSKFSPRLLNGVRDFVKDQGWEPWDIRQQEGFLRHLVIREGKRTGDVMVNLVTYGRNAERRDAFADFLQRDFPEVTTFVDTDHSGKSHNVEGDTQTVYGPGTIDDIIGDYRFTISPQSFFQTNTRQAEQLYSIARDFADLKPTDTVYDLYAGAGTISLYLSDAVEKVVGVELIDEAVADARANAAQNDVSNCTFVAGDLKTVFTDEFVETHGHPDVLIVDPPRNGMHKKVVAQIKALHPERFVYVSCNPQTQVRDLDRLRDHYRIDAVQPVDMFPHTPHIENVVALRAI